MDLDRYHASRSVSHQPFRSACYAPFVGVSFDMHGAVSVCSATRSTPLGWIGDQSLADLWVGARATELREAVLADDLNRYCSRCAEEIGGGNLHGPLARGFDQFLAQRPPSWPARMEFALSNTCNLQCIMCSGEFSSAIRARREGLPPLPSRYGDDFLEQLQPFLSHLVQARFLGGEPFLADINFRIWDLMIRTGSTAECNVTTNGTVWNRRVEAVLEALPFSIGVSIDGFRAETVEAIRVGASYARIMQNLDRLILLRNRHGGSLSLTYCLMVENWREFGDFLQFAEDRDCQVFVNTVRQPARHSLYRLPTAELREVVAGLLARRERVARRLRLNLDAWEEQITRLEGELAARDGAGDRTGAHEAAAWQQLTDALAHPGLSEAELVSQLRDVAVRPDVSILRCDGAERIVEGDDYVGIDIGHLRDGSSRKVLAELTARFGHRIEVVAETTTPRVQARVIEFGGPGAIPTLLALVWLHEPGRDSSARLAAVLAEAGPRSTGAPSSPRTGVGVAIRRGRRSRQAGREDPR